MRTRIITRKRKLSSWRGDEDRNLHRKRSYPHTGAIRTEIALYYKKWSS
jgi:hypothetical protein